MTKLEIAVKVMKGVAIIGGGVLTVLDGKLQKAEMAKAIDEGIKTALESKGKS